MTASILDLLKANKKKEDERRAASRIDTVKLKDGENIVRLLPAKDGGLPFRYFGQHFVKKDGEKMSVYNCSRQIHDTDCPICEAVYEGLARFKGDKAMENAIGKMRAARRVLWNGIVEGSDSNEPQVIELAFTAFEDIQARLIEHMEEGIGNPLDLKDGYPFVITRTGSGTDTKYTVSASLKRKKELSGDILAKCHDLDAFVNRTDEAKLLTTLNKANAVIGLPMATSVSTATASIGYASTATGTHGAVATSTAGTTTTASDDLDSLLDEELKAAVEAEYKPAPEAKAETPVVEEEPTTTSAASAMSDLDDLDALLNELG